MDKQERIEMKFQCNECGEVYDKKEDAAMCHPNVTEYEEIEYKPVAELPTKGK